MKQNQTSKFKKITLLTFLGLFAAPVFATTPSADSEPAKNQITEVQTSEEAPGKTPEGKNDEVSEGQGTQVNTDTSKKDEDKMITSGSENEEKANKEEWSWFAIIMIILAILAAAGIGYYFYSESTKENPTA